MAVQVRRRGRYGGITTSIWLEKDFGVDRQRSADSLFSALASRSDRIWTPPHLLALRFSGDEVRLLTYIRPHVDLDQPRSGHDGLFARQLPIALSGLMPADTLGFCQRRFDLFAIESECSQPR
jgi:hypothetical protein